MVSFNGNLPMHKLKSLSEVPWNHGVAIVQELIESAKIDEAQKNNSLDVESFLSQIRKRILERQKLL
jgi:hypothetical protein